MLTSGISFVNFNKKNKSLRLGKIYNQLLMIKMKYLIH